VKAELHHLRGIEYEQVPIWLNASDVLLVTSHHEGSPTIVKEALACNLPIVSAG
jgi:teichuronic acid biosynthesis glycosyltransferase TuaC